MMNFSAEEEFPVLDTEIVLDTIYNLVNALALLAYVCEYESAAMRSAAIRFVAKKIDPDLAVGFEEQRQALIAARNTMPDVLN